MSKNDNDTVFKQDQSKQETPGGPFLIQLLFREPVSMPAQEAMTEAIGRHCGQADCFFCDEKGAGFAAMDHIAQFKDGKAPVQLMILGCAAFEGEKIDPFLVSQMWDCQQEREEILSECKYQVVATDMVAAGLPARERANLDMDFLEALLELFPTCEAVYFQTCGKLFTAAQVRNSRMTGDDRFIRFGVNARFFNVQGGDDMIVDTVGMSTLFLPDLQYHFHGMAPNWVVNHGYNIASYLLTEDNPIKDGDTVDGVEEGRISQEIQWACRYEQSLIQPVREVIDIAMGEHTSGQRE